MLASRKAKKETAQGFGPSLELRAADGTLLATFSHDLVYSYRRMITGLTFRADLPRRLALLSALREEGTTYTALALGTTLASDMSVSVCVVELNWWNPGLLDQLAGKKPLARRKQKQGAAPTLPDGHPILQSQGAAGVLKGACTLDEALIPTGLPNLSLLPAGALPPEQRAKAARSQELADLLDALAGRFTHLLLDIPAVLTTSDAVAMASRADACCLVVRQGVTPIQLARQALDEIRHMEMIGVVLNRTQISTPRWLFNLIPQE